MDSRSFRLHDGKIGSALAVRVSLDSNRNEIAEILNDGTVRVSLTIAGNGQQINQALVKFLAEALDISTERIDIIAGVTGNDKLVSILDLDAAEVQERLQRRMS